MKKIIKRITILSLAALMFISVLISDYEIANATGLEEAYLYYTYWDLVSTLGYYTGYQAKADVPTINDHGVTGDQVWRNFKTWFKTYFVAPDATIKKALIDWLDELPSKVTSDGIAIDPEIYNLIKSNYTDALSFNGSVPFKKTSRYDISAVYRSVFPWYNFASPDYQDTSKFAFGIIALHNSDGLVSRYVICWAEYARYGDVVDFRYNPATGFVDAVCSDGSTRTCGGNIFDASGNYVGALSTTSSGVLGHNYIGVTLWANGVYPTVVDTSDCLDVSAEACPEEIPEVLPWRKSVEIPDEWRVLEKTETGSDPDQDPDDDKNKKKNPHVLPIPLPSSPLSPEPGPGTDPGTNPGTNPGTDPDKEPAHKLDPDVNQDDMIDSDPLAAISAKAGDFTNLFPFCIPFDIVRLVKGMRADEKPPVFHFEYKFKQINYNFVLDVDLSDYEKYIKIFRVGMEIFYVIALMFLTIKVAKLFV